MDKAHPSASASSQAAIKLRVLIEHTLGGDFKIARALCHQIADGGGGQVDCRDPKQAASRMAAGARDVARMKR